jgi:hypothetical protein
VYETSAAYQWDDDSLVYMAMVLSRLVCDNGYSLEYAARIVDHEDGKKQVIPVTASISTHTYRVREDRDWLTADEAAELRQLIADFQPLRDTLPWRVIHGLNIGEDAVHMRIIQRSLLLIATGLEGLVQAQTDGVARQFRERLPLLAAEVGVDGVDVKFARELYTTRSQAAHGAPVGMFQVVRSPAPAADEPEIPEGEPQPPASEAEPAAKLALAQDLLRAAVRKAIQDGRFRETFVSGEAVDARWPI